ncbi:MAG TPA: hypothetical protein VL522_21445, partial [Bordetella sp.]|nr:hypothetical protein [Bordetella sp.]
MEDRTAPEGDVPLARPYSESGSLPKYLTPLCGGHCETVTIGHLGPRSIDSGPCVYHTSLLLFPAPGSALRVSCRGSEMAVPATFTVRYPSVFFIPSGGPQTVELDNEQGLLAIAVSPAWPISSVPYLARAPDGGQPCARVIADPLLRAIGTTLHEELHAGSASTTYIVSLANALRDHLVWKYASAPDGKSQARTGLRSSSLRRVHSFIADNLGGPIRVDDLAGVANMSPCHFAHMFKRSMGMPPHLYIMHERVQLA